ncbi:type IX secretion system membrane protein PorP/SprF, partial [Crocinitomicaceae bacterium]|nr:type IX secretion system membrane protein PorP/SprF [Crocinitomicaceae bacterium]
CLNLDLINLGQLNRWTSCRNMGGVPPYTERSIDPLKFGYSYDFSLSEIGEYSAGSHEVFIEFQIGKKNAENNKVPWLKRNRIYTPSNE